MANACGVTRWEGLQAAIASRQRYRYILISTPGMALLVGAGLSALGKTASVSALAVVALIATPGGRVQDLV